MSAEEPETEAGAANDRSGESSVSLTVAAE